MSNQVYSQLSVPIQDAKVGFYQSIGALGVIASIYILKKISIWGWENILGKNPKREKYTCLCSVPCHLQEKTILNEEQFG